ncbi:hypothetical protein H072_7764 [Dactylellina haptotyla CBS 200.50]|uniref:Uncharacterized protein n=1 Tax=Dactylellina haptotyla (strain CBS 200.50) TaxID=1284197 RepID=S8A6L4_DACHA|nr:hypothetical protein H072_7764 [Dactylellina haptotyla CBS 200.50]
MAASIPRVRRGAPSYYTRNLQTIKSIYGFTIYPNQLPIIAQAGHPSIPEIDPFFSPTVSGRIQDIGNFTNFRTSIEYFFGLAPQPRTPTYGAISAIDITQFSSDCPSIAASTVVFTISVADPSRPDYGKFITYLKQSGFWHFDNQGRVDYYDLNIPALQDFTNVLVGGNWDDKTIQLIATKQICDGAQQVCTGANTQYKPNIGVNLATVIASLGLNPILDATMLSQLNLGSLNAGGLSCFAQLTKKPFGTFNKLWADNVACRIVHLMLAAVDPDEHCMHVGPTGGGKCVDWAYENRLFADAPLFGDKYRFICPADEL